MAVDVAAEPELAPLVVQVFSWERDLRLRVPPEEGAEVRRLLDDAGVRHTTGLEESAGPVVDLVSAVIETPQAWAALGAVFAAYLAGSHGRSVQVGDIVVKGQSAKNSMRLIRELQAIREAQSNKNPPATTNEEPTQD